MEPVTGSTYLIIFVVIVVIRHRERIHPEHRQRLEDWKDLAYTTAILAEGSLTVLATILSGRF